MSLLRIAGHFAAVGLLTVIAVIAAAVGMAGVVDWTLDH